MTDSDTVLASPCCDSPHYQVMSSGKRSDPDVDRYRCEDCGETFRELVRRPSRGRGGSNLTGLAKRVHEADS